MGQQVQEEWLNLVGTSTSIAWLLTGDAWVIKGSSWDSTSKCQTDKETTKMMFLVSYSLIKLGIPFRDTTVSKIFAIFFLASLMNFC